MSSAPDICRSCGAEIEWVETRGGKQMPLDIGEIVGGNVLLSESFFGLTVADVTAPGGGNRRSHFATCPNAEHHRRAAA